MKGSVAYAGQEPWIFSASVRENILFGKPYQMDWYNTVVDACALDKVGTCRQALTMDTKVNVLPCSPTVIGKPSFPHLVSHMIIFLFKNIYTHEIYKIESYFKKHKKLDPQKFMPMHCVLVSFYLYTVPFTTSRT